MSRKATSLAFALVLFAAGLAPTKRVALAQEQAHQSERRILRKGAARISGDREPVQDSGEVQSVEEAVKKWQFAPNGTASTQIVVIEFAGNQVR